MQTTNNTSHLIRSNIWSTQIKEILEDELMGIRYVRMLSEFTDGDTINIPSIGQAEVYDYAENQDIQYSPLDTGNFTFSITDYKADGKYITNKLKQDTFYMSELVSAFPRKQARAMMEAVEESVLKVGPNGQTASDTNTINGAYHRWVGSGTSETMNNADFAKAKYSLQKANVPMTNLVAIVDPSVGYAIETQTGLVDVTYNPMWEGIVTSGMTSGMRFIRNVYGFDVYVSHRLKQNAASETIDSVTAAAGVNNLFFSAAPDVLPFVGQMRQEPRVESEYNKDKQREEYVITARWGFGLYRPENLCVVLTDTDQVF
jgi:hypothetical protein